MSSRIVMKLYDEDKIKDEIVGSFVFNLKECIGDKVNVVINLTDFNRMVNSFGKISTDPH
jgi:hypothetical protein